MLDIAIKQPQKKKFIKIEKEDVTLSLCAHCMILKNPEDC